ncbi:L,D-transpeptidase family protein [Tianweitania sediminis]|uniref:L,D-transpeptidase family protein n=1 Tax=Tianweitania sediminis TaxID=1502156 RepID=A0A8J7RJR1_9HYPH|nr:L,D-transpeptidase family protein [Tianweitania sediminis]MBP0439736.1 L,D-transpeptidase family protein [Tianweitania sediminis]
MRQFTVLKHSLAMAIVATTSLSTVSEASAQNFFGRLFNSNRNVQQDGPHAPVRRVQPAPQVKAPAATAPSAPVAAAPAARPKPAPIKKVSAPSYYTYRTPALVPINFARLLPTGSAEITGSIEPAAAESAFDRALDGLRDYQLTAEKEIAAAIEKHYAAHPDFIWVQDGSTHARAEAALAVLDDAASYGLEPGDYQVTRLSAAAEGEVSATTEAGLIRFEMALSARVLRYIRDAHAGRINPNLISGYHDFPDKPIDYAAALDSLTSGIDVKSYLETQHPQNAEYRALRSELKTLRAELPETAIRVDPKLLLKPGQSSSELPKMLSLIVQKSDAAYKAAHGAAIEANAGGEIYTPELVTAVKAAQEAHGLKADGVIGPRTVAVIAGMSKADKINKVEVALEQLRWHPSQLGDTLVLLNAASFQAIYRENGVDKLTMRTVVGSPATQTSFFYDEIERVEYNPYWGVPRSIIVNEMLPRLLNDPGYLDRAGYEVTDAKGQRIPSSAINWAAHGSNIPYNVRQTPSEANALGELKIMFPNKHAIYMHDTPQKSFFSRDARALSHGCVRLSDPRGMAAAVLGSDLAHVEAKLAKGHSSEKITRKIPVYVAYFTAWPNQAGQVSYVPDVYDRDEKVLTALRKTSDSRAPAM